jgi:uncharacterized protein with HEPN domain
MSRGDPLRIRDYLEHIAQAVSNIGEYTAGMDEAAYLIDRKTQDAVVRNFEVIGEACNNVTRPCAVCGCALRHSLEFCL